MSTEGNFSHVMSTVPNNGFYDCFGENSSTSSTTDGSLSVMTVSSTILQSTVLPSTVSTIMFDHLSNCSQPKNDHVTPADSLFNYMEYVIAFNINRHYLYFLVGFGVTGNIVALITIWRMQQPASSSIFMGLLVFFDSVYLLLKMLYFFLTLYDVQMFDIGCKLYLCIGTFAMQMSNWTLIAFTLERFIVIWFPLKVQQLCTKKKAVMTIALIVLILGGLNLQFLWTAYEQYHPRYKWYCTFKKEYVYFAEKIWFWLDGSAYGFVPFIVIAIANIFIIIGIRISAKKQKKLLHKLTSDRTKQQQQITVMSITVSFVFLICTSPNCVLFIYQGYWNYLSSYQEYARYFLINRIIFILSDLNHAINFYLYFLSGKKFRDKFKDIFCGSFRKFISKRSTRKRDKVFSSINGRKSVSTSENNFNGSTSKFSQNSTNVCTDEPNKEENEF